MDKVSQQELSRLAELAVEAELTKRGWLVGNFNASIKNAAVYDLFAVKDQFKTTLRVKGVRLDKNLVGNLLYAVKKNGEMFLNLKKGNDSDLSVIVGLKDGNPENYYIIPTYIVDEEVQQNHKAWLKKPRKDGGVHKDTNLRQIKFDDKIDKISSGYKIKWKKYLNNWKLLENK
tara:strand:+ start:490 stop:1011 length:522 start_codon:yes stop_codon:yes gene_type:complete